MRVTLYSTTTCPYCKMEREYLKSKEITFEDILVDQDAKAAEEMVKVSGQMGVPLTVIKDDSGQIKKTILGFNKEELNQALGI